MNIRHVIAAGAIVIAQASVAGAAGQSAAMRECIEFHVAQKLAVFALLDRVTPYDRERSRRYAERISCRHLK